MPKLFDISPHLVSFGLSCFALIFALTSQYGFGLHPCEMCIWQRYPYGFAILFATLGLLFGRKKHDRYSASLLIFGALSYCATAAIAAYHAAVEYKWVEGPGGCTSSDISIMKSLEELYNNIMNTPSVMCDEPAFVFLGLSMAGWNMLYALSCFLYMIFAITYKKKRL